MKANLLLSWMDDVVYVYLRISDETYYTIKKQVQVGASPNSQP